MSRQAIAEFEAQLKKLCEHWREKMTHAELVGTLDTMKTAYHIETIESFRDVPLAGVPVPNKIAKKMGSPVPVGGD